MDIGATKSSFFYIQDACNSLSELHLLLGTDDEEQEDQPPPTEGVQLPSVSAVGRFARASFDSQKDNLLREHDSNRDPKINAETMAAVVRSIKEKKKKLQSAATDLYDEGGEYMVPSLYSGREAERDQKLLIETSRPNFDVVNTGEEVKTKAELEQIEKTLEVSRHLISSIHGNLESYSQWSGFQFSVENDREEGNNQNSSDSDNDHDATGSGNDTYASPSSNNKPSFLGRSHLKKETRSKKRDRQSSVSGGTTSREKGEYKEIEEDSYSAHRPSNYLRKKKQAENENSTSTCGLQEDSADSMQTETTISSDQPSMITAPPKPRMPRVTRYESVTIPEKDKILVTMETIISGELFLVEMHWKPAQSHILIIAKNYLRK